MAETDAPLFRVTSQHPDYGIAADGTAQKGIDVSFVTRSGAHGTVFVPYADYTLETVTDTVTERAAAMEAVHNLGH